MSLLTVRSDYTVLCKGKNHCMADLLFDWFELNQTSKSVVNVTESKK